MTSSRKRLACAAFLLSSAAFHAPLHAAGFALIENSARGLDNAFAGGAAAAEDATTVWFNPAGLTRLPGQQVVVAGHVIAPQAQFRNQGSTLNTGAPLSGSDADAGVDAFVPNVYYSAALSERLVFGIGVNAPFGLTTEYDEDWVGRYHAVESDLKTVNINPSLAYRMTDRLSLGVGVSAQYVEATLSNAIDSGSSCVGILVAAGSSVPDAMNTCSAGFGLSPGDAENDSFVTIKGDDWSYGFNVGLLYEFSEQTRFGLAYRSKMSHTLQGTADFTRSAAFDQFLQNAGPANMLFVDTGATAGAELPEMASVSAYHELNPRWAIMGDVTWTRWKRFDELRIDFENPAQPAVIVPENWQNSYRYAVGVSYMPNSIWTWRTGLAYDQTPVPDAQHRTPRIPDNDRRWLTLGFGYQPSERFRVDVAYAHLFVNDTTIDNEDPSFGHVLRGTYESRVDILSAQLTRSF